MTRIPAWMSVLALILVMIVGSWYLVVEVLTIDPTTRRNHAIVEMSAAAGLRSGSDVVYRGVNIGQVDRTESVDGGVRLHISYDEQYRIPVHSAMQVENLSALGEPTFAFMPDSDQGPWLADGAYLTEKVQVPTSVPDLLATTSNLLDQVDPESVHQLTDAFTRAMAGLEATIPEAQRGAELLLATLSRHQGSVEVVLHELVQVLRDSGWVRPSLTAAPPMLDEFGRTLGESYEYLFEGSAVLRGNEVLGSWRQQEAELADFLVRLAPEVGAIGEALRPATQATGPVLGSVDMGTLLDQAIATLPGESVRFSVNVPR